MRALVFVTAFTAMACGGRSQSPDATTAPDAPAELRVVERVEALASSVDAADCDTYAARVDAWLDDDAAEVATLARQSRAQPEVEPAALESLDARLTAAFEVVVRGADQCSEHPGASGAYRGFEAFIAET